MKHYPGEFLIGKVNTVKPYAVFLTFEDGSKGLLHISEISDSFVKDIEKFLSPGDEVNLLVLSVDDTNGFLRLSLKQVPLEKRFSTHKNVKRRKIYSDEDDFAPLENKLKKWIKIALKEVEENEISIKQKD